MKGRIASVMAAVAMVGAMLAGAPAVSAQSQLALPVATISVQAQTGAQVTTTTQPRIPWDCAKYTTRKTVCVSMASGKTYALYRGKLVKASMKYNKSSRFGGWALDPDGVYRKYRTRPGVFPINHKEAEAISDLYDVPMDFYQRFDGGIGLHYSWEFDHTGYRYSHGCVGLKSRAYAQWLFGWTRDGTRVVVTKN